MSTRVYVPSSWHGLRDLVTGGAIGPAPICAHAVTDGLRAGYAEGAEEEWEYAALTAAAHASLGLIGDDDLQRRVVVAVDAGTLLPGEVEDPTVVRVGEAVPFRRVAAVLVDSEDAEAAVRAARSAWVAAQQGDPEAERTVEACGHHELGWYAAQEIGHLLEG